MKHVVIDFRTREILDETYDDVDTLIDSVLAPMRRADETIAEMVARVSGHTLTGRELFDLNH